MISLDPRLQLVADLVRKNSVVVDVGTDHGYLISSLIQSGKSVSGFATDINVKPLAKAKEHIFSEGLDNKIKTILTDGFAVLSNYFLTDIVIAGMGGELIASLVEEADWVKNPNYRLILQPMSKPEALRNYLYTNGFELLQERTAISGEHVYSVLQVAYTGVFVQPTIEQLWLGGLIHQRDASTLTYFKKTAVYLSRKIHSIDDDFLSEKMRELQKQLEGIVNDETRKN